jgi:hypothetical protein
LAGVGNDQGAPLFPMKQANDYDKDGGFRDLWLRVFLSRKGVTKLSYLKIHYHNSLKALILFVFASLHLPFSLSLK